jgi:transcription elongation factor GreB
MSKAFTKEDDVEAPLLLPTRAPLGPGVVNYVTARGLARLHAEHAELGAERLRLLGSDEADRPHALAKLAARMAELADRIASATRVHPSEQPKGEIRFGALATVRTEEGSTRRYRVVGVDEANVEEGRIAFVAPLARALLGKRVGEVATVRNFRGEEDLEVVAIDYPED